jgi:hypothetical protein
MAAGLASKDVWRQYPRQMLRSRVISEGVKTVYPGVAVGVYTPEEVQDFDVKPPTKEVVAEVVATPVETKPAEVSAPTPSITSTQGVEASADSQVAATQTGAKKPYLDRLKNSGWNKDQLSQYAKAAFGKSDSRTLTLTEVMRFAQVVESQTFEQAMAAGLAAEASSNGGNNGNFEDFRA